MVSTFPCVYLFACSVITSDLMLSHPAVGEGSNPIDFSRHLSLIPVLSQLIFSWPSTLRGRKNFISFRFGRKGKNCWVCEEKKYFPCSSFPWKLIHARRSRRLELSYSLSFLQRGTKTHFSQRLDEFGHFSCGTGERERKIDVISETDSYHGNPEKEVSVSRPTRVEG